VIVDDLLKVEIALLSQLTGSQSRDYTVSVLIGEDG